MDRFIPLLLLALTACAPAPVTAPDGQRLIVTQPSADAACRADEFQSLVGLSSEDLLEVEILGPVTIIRPNQAVTTDFIPNRLNIALSSEDIVIRVYCG